jgi:hypothetical protein
VPKECARCGHSTHLDARVSRVIAGYHACREATVIDVDDRMWSSTVTSGRLSGLGGSWEGRRRWRRSSSLGRYFRNDFGLGCGVCSVGGQRDVTAAAGTSAFGRGAGVGGETCGGAFYTLWSSDRNTEGGNLEGNSMVCNVVVAYKEGQMSRFWWSGRCVNKGGDDKKLTRSSGWRVAQPSSLTFEIVYSRAP